ncbi:MAG TPA: hypothetical protein VN820_01645 [Acidimicrobiales bacterium]|nr:hypothetical protein [Acidimicrobiales bacterium]
MGDAALEVDGFVRRIKERADQLAWTPPIPEPLERSIDDRRLQEHPGLDYAHRHWALPDQPSDPGQGVLARGRGVFGRWVFHALAHYLHDERQLVSHLVQLNDALAKRCDELAQAHRALLQELDGRFAEAATTQEHLARAVERPARPPAGDGGT